MKPAAAIDAVLVIFRRDPADLFPFYILGSVVPAVAQVMMLLGLAITYAYLEMTDRIDRFREELVGLDLEPPSPEAEVDEFAEWFEQVVPLLELLFPPTVLAILALTIVSALVVSVILYAGISAGQMSLCYGRLRNERGLTAGIAGVRRHSLSFLGLILLEGLLWLVISAGAVGIVAFAALFSPILAVFVGLIAFAGWTVAVILVRAVFTFTPAAVVVEDVGVRDAIGGSIAFLRSNPTDAVIYYVIAIGLIAGFGTLASSLSFLGMGSIAALVGMVVITPGLDLFKTALFGDARGSISPPGPPTGRLRVRVSSGIRYGIQEMVIFVRQAPGLHGLAIAILVAGFGIGWSLAGPFESIIETSIAARLEGHIPPVAAMEFFGNNWTVTLTMMFAGVLIGIPTAFTLWFNGFMFGGYFRLEADLPELIAFVIPHGILELPAIFIAGAMGFYLARSGVRILMGRATPEAFANDLERAFWVGIGLGVLLFVAAMIEGFVSPYYYRPFL